MGFKNNVNEIKETLILVLIGIPLISSTNIDCIGKSFHCVNSTHFMICVDLGGGVSTTVDDFAIPCPPTTSCKASNRFECEFEAPTTPSPTLRTSDVTNELDISATSQLWKNSDVTTIFPPDNTSDAHIADLQTFNTVTITTLPSVTNGFINTPQKVLNKNDTVTSNIPATTEYNLTPTSEFVIINTVSSTEPLEHLTAIFPELKLNESASNIDATNIATTNIVIYDTVTAAPGTVKSTTSTESSINSSGDLTETTTKTIIEDTVSTNNKSEINVATTITPVSSVTNTTKNEMLTTMSLLVTAAETTKDTVTIANLKNTDSTISDVTINTLGIETTQYSPASQNWQPDVFQTGMQAGLLQNMTTILPNNNLNKSATNTGETTNTEVIYETAPDVPGTVISITESLITTADNLTETTTVKLVKESVPNNVTDNSVVTTDINNNINATEFPISSNIITMENKMLTTVSSLVTDTETTTDTVTIANLNITNSLFSEVTIITPLTEKANQNLDNMSPNSESDLFQSGTQSGLLENMTTISPEKNFNKSATNTEPTNIATTNTAVIYETVTDLTRAVIFTTKPESLITTAANSTDTNTINEESVYINVANKSENSVTTDVNNNSNTTDVTFYTKVNTTQEQSLTTISLLQSSTQTTTDTVTISNLNFTESIVPDVTINILGSETTSQDLFMTQNSQPDYLFQTENQPASVQLTQDLHSTEITTSNIINTISSSQMPDASDIPNGDNIVDAMGIDTKTSTVSTITTLSNVNLVIAEREMTVSTSATDTVYFTEGPILATVNFKTTYQTTQQEDLSATVNKTNHVQQTTSIIPQGPPATATVASNITTSTYNTENGLQSLNENISTTGTEVPSSYTNGMWIESSDVFQQAINVTVNNFAPGTQQEQQNTSLPWPKPTVTESIVLDDTINTQGSETTSQDLLMSQNSQPDYLFQTKTQPASVKLTQDLYPTEITISNTLSTISSSQMPDASDQGLHLYITTASVGDIPNRDNIVTTMDTMGLDTRTSTLSTITTLSNVNLITTEREIPVSTSSTDKVYFTNGPIVATVNNPETTYQTTQQETSTATVYKTNHVQQTASITHQGPPATDTVANIITTSTYNTENWFQSLNENISPTGTEVPSSYTQVTWIESPDVTQQANNVIVNHSASANQQNTSLSWPKPSATESIANTTTESTYTSENNLTITTTTTSNVNITTEVSSNYKSVTSTERTETSIANHANNYATEHQQTQQNTSVKLQEPDIIETITNTMTTSAYVSEKDSIIVTTPLFNQNFGTKGAELPTVYSTVSSTENTYFTDELIPDSVNHITQEQPNTSVKWQGSLTTDIIENTSHSSTSAATITNAITESTYSSDNQLIITTTTLPYQNLSDIWSEVTSYTRSSSTTEFPTPSAITNNYSTTARQEQQSTQRTKWNVPLTTEAFTNPISYSQNEPMKTTIQNITHNNAVANTSEGSVNTSDNYLQSSDKVDKIAQTTNIGSSILAQNFVASTSFTIQNPPVVSEKSINYTKNDITTQTYSETSGSSSSVQSTEQTINEHFPIPISREPIYTEGYSTTVKSNVVYVINKSVSKNGSSTTVTDSLSLANDTENKTVQSSSHKIAGGSSGVTNSVEGNMQTSSIEYSVVNPTENRQLETERYNKSFDISVNSSTLVLDIVSSTEPYTVTISQNELVNLLPENVNSPRSNTGYPTVIDFTKNPIQSEIISSHATLQTNVNDVMTNAGITSVDVVSYMYENNQNALSIHKGETDSTVLQSKSSSTASTFDFVISEKVSVENNDIVTPVNTSPTDGLTTLLHNNNQEQQSDVLTTTNLEQGQLDIYANMDQDVGNDRTQTTNMPIILTSLSTPLPTIIKAPTNDNSNIRTSMSYETVTKPPIKETNDVSLYPVLPGIGATTFKTSTLPIVVNTDTNVDWSQRVTNINKSETPQIDLHSSTNILEEDQQKVQTGFTTVNVLISSVPVTERYTVMKTSPSNNDQSTLQSQLAHFTCRNLQRGRYGDNADCRKFYVCIGHKEPITGLCPNNTVFSEIRKQCTKNLSHCIRENQFQCITEGRFSDYIRENNYYICVKNSHGHFVRFKFQCQKGYHLNKTSVRCQEDVEVFNQSLSSNDSPIRSTSEKKSREDKSVSNNDDDKSVSKDFECKKEGNFADPNSCRNYYKCTLRKNSEFRRKMKKCESDEVFHKDKKKCVDAESHEC